MVTWQECQAAFKPDGSLLDVHVREGGLAAWERALSVLLTRGRARYAVDGVAMPLPASARESLAERPAHAPLLNVEICGIDFACHFFGVQEVELDFSPADVSNTERFAALLSLRQALGEATGCEVVVTPENEPGSPFLRYDVAAASVTCSLAGR